MCSRCHYGIWQSCVDTNLLYWDSGRPTRFCGGLKFECSDSMGAVIVLLEGGFHKDLLVKRLFLHYAMHNATA